MRARALIAGAALAALAACSGATLSPAEIAALEGSLSAASIALAQYQATRCAPEIAKGVACAETPAEIAAQSAITDAKAVIAAYIASPTTTNASAVTASLNKVSTAVAATKTGG